MDRVASTVRAGADELWADDGGSGPALVLLHPGVGDSRVWDPVLPLLAGYRVIRYDCRGYGSSAPSTEPYTQLADLVAVLDHFGLDRVTLVGSSMGGGTALGLALTSPARVDGLVLACPAVPGHAWPPGGAWDEAVMAAEQAGDGPELTRLYLEVLAAAGNDDTTADLMLTASRAWLSEAGHERPAEPLFDRLAEITAPTVVLVGDLDRDPLVAADRYAAEQLPRGRFELLPGVDHYLPLRAPEAVAAAVRSLSAVR
jgi:pimeloyl-ACP methyl ester carboxylesterase